MFFQFAAVFGFLHPVKIYRGSYHWKEMQSQVVVVGVAVSSLLSGSVAHLDLSRIQVESKIWDELGRQECQLDISGPDVLGGSWRKGGPGQPFFNGLQEDYFFRLFFFFTKSPFLSHFPNFSYAGFPYVISYHVPVVIFFSSASVSSLLLFIYC